jgi:threonine dehydrogenase-like Zn-dependent dehydrogenase
MQLMLTAPRTVELVDDRLPTELSRRDVRLRSIISGISHGTELNLYRGNAPTLTQCFDLDLRAYLPRTDQRSPYPVSLGYEVVAEVVAVGVDVTEIAVGDIVHIGLPHREEAIVDVDAALALGYPLVVLPPTVEPEQAIFISLGSVALVAVHDSAVKLGDTVAVFGLGAIGMLVAQAVRAAGATTVVAVDPVAQRRDLAKELGVDTVIDPGDGTAARPGVRIKELIAGGVDIAIETSASYAALHEAITAVTVGGRVVSVAYYLGGGDALRLGEEWHINRPEMVSSMGLWGCPHRSYPAWDRERVTRVVLDLLASRRLTVTPLLTHTWPISDADSAYRAIDANPPGMIRGAFRYG